MFRNRSLAWNGILGLFLMAQSRLLAAPLDLRVGTAGHAFDHLGAVGEQEAAAVASGANIIYVTGVGGAGYSGLPPSDELQKQREAAAAYLTRARAKGIKLAIGYVCATSIVHLPEFDRNWPGELSSRFQTHPAAWRQQGRDGKPLASWYGGDYAAACMNNPGWREYEKFIIRQQLELGCDGIFFDNPTVHPQGCYCPPCMEKFVSWLERENRVHVLLEGRPEDRLTFCRELAEKKPAMFLEFRSTIARDFLEEMRAYVRTIKPGALVTANNSLNSSGALYSQCRTYGYNIYEMSKAEDYIVVEDMSSQPRTLPDGRMIEYGPTYEQLHAIGHGKPVVAVALADADYHTPPQLVRLAMAEAAAHQSSHLWWPTWPENQRERMAAAIRPQADFLRRHAELLDMAERRHDVLLFLPFRNWLKTEQCKASALASELGRANIQYQVVCEDHLADHAFLPGKDLARLDPFSKTKVILTPSSKDLLEREAATVEKFKHAGGLLISADDADWLEKIRTALKEPSVLLEGPKEARVIVHDQPARTVVHLLNLNVQRLTSFTDRVTPARDIKLMVRVPFQAVTSARVLTADAEGTSGPVTFSRVGEKTGTRLEVQVPRLDISALLVIE